jgi:AFG3 family protein
VDEAYKQCRDLLEEKKKEVGLVAEELLSKEVLSRDDMIRILGPRPFEEKGDFHKYFRGKNEPPLPGETMPGPPGLPENLQQPPPPQGPVEDPNPAPTLFQRSDWRKD